MKKRVITYGTFDMFHVGHLNILKRAKAFGDYLIVGVTSEEYDRSRGKLNVAQDLQTRINSIKKLSFVDEVIVEHHKGQKIEDIKKYNINTFVIGDDWVGKFDYLKKYCEVIYLPRTEGISSSTLRKGLKTTRIGIIGTGRIANRFAQECTYVNGMEINSVFSRNIDNIKAFLEKHNVLYGFNNLNDFLDSDIEAVYVASPHEHHFEQSKQALNAGKHVLCEKPGTLKDYEMKEILSLAKSKNLIYLEAIKTAYFPAFRKLLNELESGIIGDIIDVKATFTKLIEDENLREWNSPYGGAVNEMASYPLLLAIKVLGKAQSINFYDQKKNGVDYSNNILCLHDENKVSFSTVGIGAKSEGCAVISGTKGYVYIPAPWWLTKRFYVRFEDPNKEYDFSYDFEGDGLRYEIAEFASLIQRGQKESKMLSYDDMININEVISLYNNNPDVGKNDQTII